MAKPKKKSGHSKPYVDHTLDPADAQVHADPRAADVGASGTTSRGVEARPTKPVHVDHGIDQVLKETDALPKDRGGEPADPDVHEDKGESGVGARGAIHR